MRSFVRRGGRLTAAQQRALDTLWPAWGIEFSTGRIDLDAVFGRRAPCVLEIGFGNGETLLADAMADPDKNFVGIEVHRPGVGRLLIGLQKHELDNVRVICHDAVEVLREQIPASALDAVRIYFPDPWPKKRHHKRRLIQPAFLELVAGVLKTGGRLHIATDWQAYAEHIHECLEAAPAFVEVSTGDTPDDARAEAASQRAQTKFERRGRQLGHDVRDFIYRKVA